MNLPAENAPSLAVLRKIHLAMGFSVLSFVVAISVLAITVNISRENPDEFGYIAGYLSLFFTMIFPFVAQQLFTSMIRKKLSGLTAPPQNPYSVFLQPHLLRLALIEAMALFALVILLIQINQTQTFSLSLTTGFLVLSLFVFFILWFHWFPTEEKVQSALSH